MALNSVQIPYPDFKLYEIIDPEQHDANNAELVARINAVIDMLNSVIGGEVADNISATAVSINPIEPFVDTNVGAMLNSLISKLYSVDGAGFVKLNPIAGLEATNVQEALAKIYDVIDDIDTTTGSTDLALQVHKSSGDHDQRYYKKTEIDTKLVDIPNFVKKDGNFEGTWKNMTLEQVATYASGNPAFVEVLETDPPAPFIGQMWMVVGGE